MDEYSDISKDLTSDLDKSIKDGQGIFFTPPKSIRKIVNYIDYILSFVMFPCFISMHQYFCLSKSSVSMVN